MDFAEKIKDLRAKTGLSQAAFATRIGISQAAVAAYEIGRREPTATMLATLAKGLGVPMEDLIDDDAVPILADDLKKPYVHGNSRVAKIQEVFEQLKPQHQRAILQQAEALLEISAHRTTGRPRSVDHKARRKTRTPA